MDRGTKEGSVTKRKRKRETARRVLDVLEDKAKQQIECSQQLEHTMKGIYYRLSSIQRILENDAYEKDINTHYQRWLNEDFTHKRKHSHEVPRSGGAVSDKLPSWPATQVYHATVQGFTGDFPIFTPRRVSGDVPHVFGTSVSFGTNTTAAYGVMSHDVQEMVSFGGRPQEAGTSPHESQSGASAPAPAAASDLQRPRTAPCMCDQREASAKKRLHDRPGQPRAATPVQRALGPAAQSSHATGPQEFTDKELESAFDEEDIPDTVLAPNERLFMTEYPELDKDFEPKRDYPLPFTPGQNYPGKFFEAQVFTDNELQNAFDTEEIPDVVLKPNEKLFMSEFPSLTSPAHSYQAMGAGPCPCAGTKVVKRSCPMKKRRLAGAAKPQYSAATVAHGGGDAQQFSDKDLENVFDEEVIEDVSLGPNERLFVTEYPELNKDFEPKRDYPLPFTPMQYYSGKFCEAQEFSAEELEKAFDAEEIPDVTLQPNECLFMIQFPSLAGDWTPMAPSARAAVSAASTAAGGTLPPPPVSGELTCACGRKIPHLVCPTVRARLDLPGQRSDAVAPRQIPSAPGASAVTVTQKPTTKPGEPQVFDDKELETAFDEEEIPDVKLEPNERLFMKEFPELDKDFEPKREYPLPFTPLQMYSGKFCDAQQFTEDELESAFDEEEILEVEADAGVETPEAAAGRSVPPPRDAPKGKRCCTCGRMITGIVCPSTQDTASVQGVGPEARMLPPATYKSDGPGSAVTVAQKHTAGSGEPQVFDDKELENVFDEEPFPDVSLDPNERLFMKEYPELDKDFEPKREYPLPFTPGQVYTGTFCEAQTFPDNELEKAFDTEDIPDVHLQPNERVFMMDFPAFAGDWKPTSAVMSVRSMESAAKGAPPTAASGERAQPSQVPRCRNCGKRLAKICPMKQALLDEQQLGRAISPPAAFKSAPASSAVTVAQKHLVGAGEPQIFDDKELENVFDEETIQDVDLGPTERLFMKDYPELDKDMDLPRIYPLPFTPGQKYTGKFCDAQEFSAEELEKAFDSEEIPDIILDPNDKLFMMEFPSLAGNWTPRMVPSAKVFPKGGVTGSAQICCVCGKPKKF